MALFLILLSLQALALLAPQGLSVRASDLQITEIHYRNKNRDKGEMVEVSGPAGEPTTGCNVVLYDGADGTAYDTLDLGAQSQTIPDQGNGFGSIVVTPTVKIQNGMEGVALECNGTLIEFLSYKGTFQATSGVANGTTSIDIGVSEGRQIAAGLSLQKTDEGWIGPATATFNVVNKGLLSCDVYYLSAFPRISAYVSSENATFTFCPTHESTTNEPTSPESTPDATSTVAQESTATPTSTSTAGESTSAAASTVTQESTSAAGSTVTQESSSAAASTVTQESTSDAGSTVTQGSTSDAASTVTQESTSNATVATSSEPRPAANPDESDEDTTEKSRSGCLPLGGIVLKPVADAVEKIPLIGGKLLDILCAAAGILPV